MSNQNDSTGNISLPAFCGPEQLAEVSILFRNVILSACSLPDGPSISDQNLKLLVQLCAAASLLKEEGVNITCQLNVRAKTPTSESVRWTTLFVDPIEFNDPQSLRKIARACSSNFGALIVEERQNALWIIGIQKVRRDLELGQIGNPVQPHHGHANGITIEIRGPGHLLVYGTHKPIELNGGRMHLDSTFFVQNPGIYEIFNRIADSIFGERVGQKHPAMSDSGPGPNLARYILADAWQRVINGSRFKNHGGAFIISNPQSLRSIDMKHRMQGMSLGTALVDLWDKSFNEERPYTLQQYRDWRDAKVRVDAYISQLILYSTVDGAVVLDGQLEALGFGAKIRQRQKNEFDHITFINPLTKAVDDGLPDRIRKLGTRHQSAFDLCCEHDKAVAFVISQDGDVRIFWREGLAVSMIEPTAIALSLNWIPDAIASINATQAFLKQKRMD